MMSRATTAGVLSIISIVIPWSVFYSLRFNYLVINWQLFEFWWTPGEFELNYFAQWDVIDKYLSIFSFLPVLVGAILLLTLHKKPKAGASLVLVGMLIFVVDIVYDGLHYSFWTIPIAPFIALIAAILGFVAKPVSVYPTGASGLRQQPVEVDRFEELAKLKKLLDSGAITKEEYEQIKKKILEQT